MKKTYQDRKAEARDEAKEWQMSTSDYKTWKPLSWGEYAELVAHFEKLAKRYGLIKEFKEKGII